MKKLILFLMIIFLNVGIANAKGLPNSFDNAFSETGLSKHVVSISIQDIDKPKKLYELNYEKPMMPASTQKLITAIPAIEVLGKDYKFSTKLYKMMMYNKNKKRVEGHLTCVIDNHIMDIWDCRDKIVDLVWEVK